MLNTQVSLSPYLQVKVWVISQMAKQAPLPALRPTVPALWEAEVSPRWSGWGCEWWGWAGEGMWVRSFLLTLPLPNRTEWEGQPSEPSISKFQTNCSIFFPWNKTVYLLILLWKMNIWFQETYIPFFTYKEAMLKNKMPMYPSTVLMQWVKAVKVTPPLFHFCNNPSPWSININTVTLFKRWIANPAKPPRVIEFRSLSPGLQSDAQCSQVEMLMDTTHTLLAGKGSWKNSQEGKTPENTYIGLLRH